MNSLKFQQLSSKKRLGIGVCNGLGAILASKYKYDFLWLSSFELSMSKGVPDSGIVSIDEVASELGLISRHIRDIPIIVDLDSGHGDPLQCYYACERVYKRGAHAVCIEDHGTPKRSSLDKSAKRSLADIEDQVEKILSAKNAAIRWGGEEAFVIARTESLVAGEEPSQTIPRLESYLIDGKADAIFIQNTDKDTKKLQNILSHFKGSVPIFVTPTCYPEISHSELYALGVTDIILANYGVRSMYKSLEKTFRELRHSENSNHINQQVPCYSELVDLVKVDPHL